MASPQRNIAVIGLGTFGGGLAEELSRMGDRVVGIDRDPEVVAARTGVLDRVVELDASDPRALAQVGIDAHDVVVVSIGSDIQASALAAMNARDLKCPQVWAKAASPAHERILRAIGIERVLRPEQEFAELVAHRIHNPGLRGVIALGTDRGGRRLHMAHLRVPVGGIGKSVGDLGLRKAGLDWLGVTRDGEVFTGNCEAMELRSTDGLLIHGAREDLRRFSESG